MTETGRIEEQYHVRYWEGREHTNWECTVKVPVGRTLSGELRRLGIRHVYSVERVK